MKTILKYCSMVLLFYCFASSLNAQDQLQTQFEYANNLFESKQYFDAITEYKRLLFFDSQRRYAFQANYRIGQSYKAGAKFDEAIRFFTLADLNSDNNAQKYSAKIEIIKSNILKWFSSRQIILRQ